MKILFLTSAHNSMSQRAYVELTERGHRVSVHVAADGPEGMIGAVRRDKPELIVAPMLKTAIPESIWRHYTCLIVHPGIKGDRGSSSLDWAILDDAAEWGVTVLQANEEMDAGDIWATASFPMRRASKSELYRHEVTEAAMRALLLAVERFAAGGYVPEPLDYAKPDVKGRLREPMKQSQRRIDWSAGTARIAAQIRSADSAPGVLDAIGGEEYYLYGVHEEDMLTGRPGELIAWRNDAVCRATGDGALWISHVRRRNAEGRASFKLPASLVLRDKLARVPESPLAFDAACGGRRTYREIRYEERGEVGYLQFDFYNGAMSTEHCRRLREAYAAVKRRPTKAIVLMGGADLWSNGIHLNVIEAADRPADESWDNIQAMNDLVRELATDETRLVISAMQGNAGAGGVVLALAADFVYARRGVVLNPHYRGMGGLYGSEYWTYLLPRRVGPDKALELTERCLPIGAAAAKRIGLIDDAFGDDAGSFRREAAARAERLAQSAEYRRMLAFKRRMRAEDERIKPLERYRAEELEQMHRNFYHPDSQYHEARRRFVYKIPVEAMPAPAQPFEAAGK